ncbi:hypothetical protein KFK09_003810 [Dendrobium nobile]|uniref:CCHC-type domain-containing protein n=1 Tax=Dendrobium nobile TaxID=94219 RepID=A0A8T3C472_DENNO|nr:hypothetical protein KFK09_003810 [Dendrobium nobile]
MNVQRSMGSQRANGKSSSGIVIREGLKPHCRPIAVEGKGKSILVNGCENSNCMDGELAELAVLDPIAPENLVLRVNNFSGILDLKKERNMEKNVLVMENRNADSIWLKTDDLLKTTEDPLSVKDNLGMADSLGNKNEIVDAWSKPKHIKIAFSKDQVEFTDDGVAVKMDSDTEVKNMEVLKNSIVIKVLGSNIPFSGISAPVWIRLPNVPLYCWDEKNLARIASCVGTPMFFDNNTFRWGKREFARICVRIELEKKLLNGVWVEGVAGRFFQRVEYEKINLLCYQCGKVGHEMHSCPDNVSIGILDQNKDKSDEDHVVEAKGVSNGSNSVNSSEFGPWIHVQFKNSKKFNKNPSRNNIVGEKMHKENNVILQAQKNGNLKMGTEEFGEEAGVDRMAGPAMEISAKYAADGNEGKKSGDVQVLNSFSVLSYCDEDNENKDDGEAARKKEASLYLKELVRDHNVFFIGLMETKVSNFTRKDIDCFIGKDWEYWHHPAIGSSGGILVLWNMKLVSFMVKDTSSQAIIGDLLIPTLGTWRIATIYGSRTCVDRGKLWKQLEDWMEDSTPSIIGGDYNCILSKEDKRGGKRFLFSKGPKEMKSFMVNYDFHDIGYIGPRFTWCNNKEGTSRIWERLDRCLLNSSAIQKVPLAITKHLARIASDHSPILLKLDTELRIKSKIIRFEDTWRSYPACKSIVNYAWKKKDVGNESEILQKKTNRTLKALFFWSRNKCKNLKNLKEKLKEEIEELQKKEALGEDWNEEDLKLLRFKVHEFNVTLRRLSTWWNQRAKAIWHEEECKLTDWPTVLQNQKIMVDDNFMLNEAFTVEDLKSLVFQQGPRITHLLYADDVLIFSHATSSLAKLMKKIVEDFCNWSGQRVNLNKSQILFGKNVRKKMRKKITNLLGIKMVKEMIYLGVKMALRRLKIADFQELIGNVLDRLNAWCRKSLSLGGKIVLIESSLLSMPNYLITNSLIPKRVLLELEKLCRNFIWHKQNGDRGIHYESWDEIYKPKKFGGLGLHCPLSRIGSLRSNVAWNFLQKPDSLFHKTMKHKYGDDILHEAHHKTGSSAWHILLDGGKALKNIARWNIGNGKSINVLNDTWLHDKCLNRWPTFINCVYLENATISEFLLNNGDWNYFKLQIAFHQEIIEIISQISIDIELKLNKKVETFWRRLGKKAIPTNVFLKNRKISDFINCARGCDSIESYEHIMVNCKYLIEVIMRIREWGIQIPFFNSLDDCLHSLKALTVQNSGMVKLYCTIVYLSWKNRNEIQHQKTAIPSSLVAANALYLATSNVNPFLVSWGTNLPRESLHPWCPPPKDWIKINVDASLLESNQAGIGGIFRDHMGRFISAFGKKRTHWNIAQLELDAIFAAKDFLCDWMLECKEIIVESDNVNIINFIHDSLKKKNKWLMDRWSYKDLCLLKDFNKEWIEECYKTQGFMMNIYRNAVYLTWKSRNKLIHGDKEDCSIYITSYVVSMASISFMSKGKLVHWGTNQSSRLSNRWYHPPPNWIKINVDASFLQTYKAGVGGVVQDSKGIFLLAYGHSCIHWDIASLELFFICFIREIAKDWMRDFQGIIKEGNNYNVIKFLQNLGGVNQRNLDACEKKKEKTMALKANNRNFDSSGKPGHVRADCPTLQDHSSKEKGEEKPKFRKDKKRLQKAFWADSAFDSSELEPEDETTNLCLMAEDHLDQSDEEEVLPAIVFHLKLLLLSYLLTIFLLWLVGSESGKLSGVLKGLGLTLVSGSTRLHPGDREPQGAEEEEALDPVPELAPLRHHSQFDQLVERFDRLETQFDTFVVHQ